MKRAWCDIREAPHYRSEAFIAGLKACGYHVLPRQLPSAPPGPEDVLVIWNRYSDKELTADKWEAQGGTVLVAENGYIGRDAEGRQHYALAIHGHNGSGRWPEGGPERWEHLGIALAPWRVAGDHILVCPNRHFGMKGFAMPYGWEKETVAALRRFTKRPIRVRPHPGNNKPDRPLAEDLAGAWACVIWSSSCGVHALAQGIPVYCNAPWWICKSATQNIARVEDELPGDLAALRLAAMQRLAWAQWTVEEIARGEPFRRLLSPARESQSAACV